MSSGSGTTSTGKRPTSRLLHVLDDLSSTSWVALTIVGLDLLWVLFSLWLQFPTRLERVFQTLVAAITLAMVFVIQHTQAREQEATQRKLDEILAALPDADNSVISLEDAPDDQLRATARKHREVRDSHVGDD
ncbi:low affinity iron permease family protein [Nocardioides cynanchi]|uniref:low affinity iron permease family protein n=1 Tax=Nocardioides cynanchi TaxID=2558918 RepID=UPI001780715E|nr:low affinity iron permease family protein [Nocardioides cynanchi]